MFIGRERELSALDKIYKTNKFQFAVIYGRRRVGKTAIINEFVKDKDAICFTGVETNAKQNLENFSKCIFEFGTGIEADTTFASFQAALEYVFKLTEKQRIVLVIDEYPYVARTSKSLAKMAWDYVELAEGYSDIMNIRKITDNKKEYIDLLLLADEQEDMIDKYLERGEMFVLDDYGIKAECVITQEGDGVYELKNIAVLPGSQRKGYGKRLIEYLFSSYIDCNTLLVGTGDVPSALAFYKKCGFTESHRIKNFFIDNYDHPMFEDGKQLVDMVYLKWER